MSAINPFRDTEETYLNDVRIKLARLRAHRAHYVAVMDALAGENSFFVTYDGKSLDLHFSGDRDRFTRIFGAIRRLGWVPVTRPERCDTYFTTFMNHPDGARIYLAFSSTTCRKVQVGTKMVEQPIYETICDGASAEEVA